MRQNGLQRTLLFGRQPEMVGGFDLDLARDEIAAGRLVPIGAPAVAIGGAYWLTWPPERTDDAPLRAFRAWLSAETA